jgi:hypothetical protein
MATLPSIEVEQAEPKLSLDEAAADMYKLIEGYYDEIGLSEADREKRYEAAGDFIKTVRASHSAKSA